MKRNLNKENTSNSTGSIVSCVIAVLVLILILCGDMIISHFLPIHPNDNYTLDKNSSQEQEVFDSSFMEKITLGDLIQKIDQKETLFVFSGRNNETCQKFVSILKEVSQEKEIFPIYYLERSEISENTLEYSRFIKYSKTLEDLFSITPYFMKFQNGFYQGDVIGMRDQLKEDLLGFFQFY